MLWDDLIADVRRLRRGEPVRVPVPGTRALARGERPETVGPSRVAILEGHLLFNRPDLLNLLDLRLFTETNVHERVVRRLLRDTAAGRTRLEAAAAWYRRDVRPHIEPYSERWWREADLVVPCEGDLDRAVASVGDWVERRLAGEG